MQDTKHELPEFTDLSDLEDIRQTMYQIHIASKNKIIKLLLFTP